MPKPFVALPVFLFTGALTRSRSGDAAGFGFRADVENNMPHFEIRPCRLAHSEVANPCDYIAHFRYEQNGLEDAEILLSLVCGGEGGIVGSSAALDIRSNYPELWQDHRKFKFSQPGKGIQLKSRLPRDYLAMITLKFWIEGAKLAARDCIQLEISHLKGQGTPISFGKATLYPSESQD